MPCPSCGTPFRPQRRSGGRPDTRTCSKQCGVTVNGRVVNAVGRKATWQASNRRRRAMLRGRESDRYTTDQIAGRDGYRCALCKRKVDMSKQFPDPRSPSIDHVLPLSLGGDDTRANVQLAHLGCNAGKGAGGNDQLRLVG